jgi:hypothetical protein
MLILQSREQSGINNRCKVEWKKRLDSRHLLQSREHSEFILQNVQIAVSYIDEQCSKCWITRLIL